MRLLIPLFIVLLGMGSGVLICFIFRNLEKGLKISAMAGGFGAFAGLMMRDFLDDVSGGLIGGALLAAIVGAIVVSAVVNAGMRIINR
jgi:uncharacterized membrane protein YeaQ/YmgE (transglycosylase-associated protein family)